MPRILSAAFPNAANSKRGVPKQPDPANPARPKKTGLPRVKLGRAAKPGERDTTVADPDNVFPRRSFGGDGSWIKTPRLEFAAKKQTARRLYPAASAARRNVSSPVLRLFPIAVTPKSLSAWAGYSCAANRPPKVEVINDYSSDVSNLFRVLQRHYVPFVEMIRYQLTGRAEFERLTAADPETLTDLERATRFLSRRCLAFGGNVAKRGFGVSPDRPSRFNVTQLEPMLADRRDRLAGVVIIFCL